MPIPRPTRRRFLAAQAAGGPGSDHEHPLAASCKCRVACATIATGQTAPAATAATAATAQTAEAPTQAPVTTTIVVPVPEAAG